MALIPLSEVIDRLVSTMARDWLMHYCGHGQYGMALAGWTQRLTAAEVFTPDIIELLRDPVTLDERLGWMEENVRLETVRSLSYKAFATNFRGNRPTLTEEQAATLERVIERATDTFIKTTQYLSAVPSTLALEGRREWGTLTKRESETMTLRREATVELPVKDAVLYRVREGFLAPLCVGQLLGVEAATLEDGELTYVFPEQKFTAPILRYLSKPGEFLAELFSLVTKIGGHDFLEENETEFAKADDHSLRMFGKRFKHPSSYFNSSTVENLRGARVSFVAEEDNIKMHLGGVHIGDINNVSNHRRIANFAAYSPRIYCMPTDWRYVEPGLHSKLQLSKFIRKASNINTGGPHSSIDNAPPSSIDLTKLVGFQHPNRSELDVIIAEEGTRPSLELKLAASMATPYSRKWEFIYQEKEMDDDREVYSELHECLESILPKNTLIDLGCGDVLQNLTMLKVAQRLGIQSYIGVDRYNVGFATSQVSKRVESAARRLHVYRQANPAEFNDLDAQVVRADMLDFTSRLVPETYSFTINGIDDIILLDRDGRYSKALAAELSRASKPGSVVFGCNSQVFNYLEDAGFQVVDLPEAQKHHNNVQIFCKKRMNL